MHESQYNNQSPSSKDEFAHNVFYMCSKTSFMAINMILLSSTAEIKLKDWQLCLLVRLQTMM